MSSTMESIKMSNYPLLEEQAQKLYSTALEELTKIAVEIMKSNPDLIIFTAAKGAYFFNGRTGSVIGTDEDRRNYPELQKMINFTNEWYGVVILALESTGTIHIKASGERVNDSYRFDFYGKEIKKVI